MDVVTSGTLVIAKGEVLSVSAGEIDIQFNEKPSGAQHGGLNISVPFGLPIGHSLPTTGQFPHGGVVYRHRIVFQSTGQPDVVVVHYTVTKD